MLKTPANEVLAAVAGVAGVLWDDPTSRSRVVFFAGYMLLLEKKQPHTMFYIMTNMRGNTNRQIENIHKQLLQRSHSQQLF